MNGRAVMGGLLLLAGLIGAACQPERAVELEPLPRPSLDAVDPQVREQLESAQGQLEALLGEGASAADQVAAWGRLGQLYHAYEMLGSAAVCYRNADRLAPRDVRWLYYLGSVDHRRGQLEEAAEAFTDALAIRSDDAATWWRLGEVELARNRPGAAKDAFSRAIELEPACHAALYGLGNVARSQGDFAGAAEKFSQVLEQQPHAASVRYALAQTLLRLGRVEEARPHLAASDERAVKVGGKPSCPDPLDAELGRLTTGVAAHLTLGRHAAFSGHAEVEVAEYRKAVELAPEDPVARQSLGSALARRGELEEALAQYAEAVRLLPGNADFRHDLGLIAFRLGRLDMAEQAFEKALELKDDHQGARHQLARVRERQGRLADALAIYDELLRHQEANTRARVERALIMSRLGRRQEALAELVEVMTASPPADPEEQLNLATAIGALGDVERALRHLGSIAETATQTSLRAQAHLRMAVLLESRGDVAGAVAELRRALAVDPGLAPARQALERLTRSP